MLRSFSRLWPRLVSHNATQATVQTTQVRTLVQSARLLSLASDIPSDLELAKGEKLNDYEKRKLMRKFAMYDINGDGMIQRDDYNKYIQKIKDIYNLHEGDELLHAFQQEFEAHWSRMLKFMDENKDGVLSLDEWMSYYPRVTRTPRAKTFDNLPGFLQTLADALYKLMDGKRDNMVDAEEYREFWGRWDPPPISVEEARQHMAHMTENGKYKLTLERYRDCYADFTWGKREGGIGKYVMGPLNE